MKKTVLLIGSLLAGYLSFSQDNTSGTIVYEQTVKMEIKMEGDAAQFAAMLPKERKSEKVLYFNGQQSLYENKKATDKEDVTMQSGGATVMVRMADPENKVYTDIVGKKQIEMKEFMTRTFLIDRDISYSWKMTGNQKMIQEYPCQEATCTDGDKKVVAWFTPAIPVSSGPGKYGGLPGLILSVELDEGKNVTTIKTVDLTPVAKDKIVVPEKGKKVTNEEFTKIVEEKMKEMGGQVGAGGGSQMYIRIQK